MKKKNAVQNREDNLSELRSRANKVLQRLGSTPLAIEGYDHQQLFEELNVYHIELELQNDELQKTRDKLESSQQYLDDLFAYAPVGYVVMNIDGKIRDINETAARSFMIDRKFFTGQRLQSFIPQESFLDYNECTTTLMEKNAPQHVEVRLRVSGNRDFWARLDMFMLDNPSGSDKLVLCSILDITHEKKMEQELISLNKNLEAMVAERTKELQATNRKLAKEIKVRQTAENEARQYAAKQSVLVREIHHRVKNNMQIVVSLLKLQSKQIENDEALIALSESQNRVKALAMIHEILYQSDDLSMIPFAQYLKKLARHLAVAYNIGNRGIQLTVNSKVNSLHIDQAVPIGLIVTELVTNSIKYAFSETKTGNITIQINPSGDDFCELKVADDGIGLAADLDPAVTQTMGLRLMLRLAEDQLNGSVDIRRDGGTEVVVRFKKKLVTPASEV